MRRALPILGLAAAALLSACSSSEEIMGTQVAAQQLLAALNPAPAEPFPEPTRAQLDADGRPLLRAFIPDRDANALLFQIGANGPFQTWATVDAKTLSLNDGLLTQTRGLGGDLMSSRLPPGAAIRSARGQVTRMHTYLGPNDQTLVIEFDCVLSDQGAEQVTISGLGYATRRVAERCAGPGIAFENLYWVQSGGKIRQSLQWVGPDVGNVALFDLRR
jgi:hypothetical protein